MAIEIIKGTIATHTEADQDKASMCRVGEREIELHRDLADRIKVGDEVAISCQIDEQSSKALAIDNLSQKRISAIDPTNLVLIMGASGFICLVFFILAGQNMTVDAMALVALNAAVGVVGAVGIAVTITRLLALRHAQAMLKN